MRDLAHRAGLELSLLLDASPILSAIFLGLLGALLGGLVLRGEWRIGRAPFFGLLVLSTLMAQAPYVAWLAPHDLDGLGPLWLSLFQIAAILASGALLIWAGMARSRDMIGNARLGWFALVPVLNFALLIAKPADPGRARPGWATGLLLTTGVMGALAAAAFPSVIAHVQATRPAQVPSAPVYRALGVERAVQALVTHFPLPIPSQVDEVTTLIGIDGTGDRFTYRYAVTYDSLDPSTDATLRRNYCATPETRAMLDSGITIGLDYDRASDGSHLLDLTVTAADCD